MARIEEKNQNVRELTLDEGGEERDVGGLPPAGGQRHADLVQLLPQQPTPILRLGPEIN